jgi:2-amino-4-hydroxy-6-hydroxymethyldihydropteridine diphosphokinase
VGQADFLNACIVVETELDPDGLLTACKDVELELGRDPAAPRHAARPIDVDVLLIDGREHRSPQLRVPHAEIMSRRFVLEPLLELDPPDRDRFERALAEVADQRVTRAGTL